MTNHVHDMKSTEASGTHKCSSCLFRCTTKALPQVEASPAQHRIVKKGSKQAKEVWNG